jgi:hypothetical protein
MSEIVLVPLGLVLAVWCLWLERRVRALTDEKDALCSTLIGIARGTHTVEINHGKVTVKVTGL